MEIMEARQQDMDALAALFAEGFQRDPLFCHYIPYEQEREGILKQIFLKYLNDYWEVLTVLEVPPLAGAMCIYPSGAQGTERMVLPAHIRKVYDRINQVAAPQFYEDYLTLDLLAVRPEFRGRGIARALVEVFSRRAKEAEKPGIVEIYEPANVAFYEKAGFRLAHIQPVGETLTAYILEI